MLLKDPYWSGSALMNKNARVTVSCERVEKHHDYSKPSCPLDSDVGSCSNIHGTPTEVMHIRSLREDR
jgi:hypothetical protein